MWKEGHFQWASRSKKISSVKDTPEQTNRRFFLGVVRGQKTEPKIPYTSLELSRQEAGMDLFKWQKLAYLMIVDYYSRFIEIAKLDNG